MGFTMYGLGFCVPLLKHDLGISRATASFHNLGFALMITLTSFWLPSLITRYSPRKVMLSGWIIAITSLLAFTVGRSLWVTVPAMSIAGLGATLFNNTNAVSIGQSAGMSIQVMLRQTGIATVSGAISPSIIGFLIRQGISWRVTLAAFALIFGVIALKTMPSIPDRSPLIHRGEGRHWDKSLLILVGLGFTASGLEVTTGSWALDLLISRGMLLSVAVVAVTVVSYGIGLSRLGLAMTTRLGVAMMWWCSAALTATGLLLIVLGKSSTVTMLGLIIAAVGIGPLSALALAIAAISPKGADAGIAANVIGAGPVIGIGSWVIGIVSDSSGFSVAYLIPLMMLVAASGFFLASQDKSSTT
jgi:predicted MFS family arabinose efflux permease